MGRQLFFVDMSPAAGIVLVLMTIALSGVMWAILFAGWRIAEARATRRAKAAEALIGKTGKVILVADPRSGIVRLDPENGTTAQVKCRTESGVLETGRRVRVVGFDGEMNRYIIDASRD